MDSDNPSPGRYSADELRDLVAAFARDGFVILREHFDPARIALWHAAFAPLLERHLAAQSGGANRGSARHYVTLPFRAPFADPRIYDDPDIVELCRGLVGEDMWMCQLASDTPLRGSAYQDIHRDAPPLFGELLTETPPFQLAVNFPLIDVTAANGPTEIAPGTHQASREAGLARLERGEVALQPIEMRVGDVMIRDVRGLHRGTPNRTEIPRPMVVIGYSRRWLLRPEVSIRIERSIWTQLSQSQRFLLRFNPIIDDGASEQTGETYQAFAF